MLGILVLQICLSRKKKQKMINQTQRDIIRFQARLFAIKIKSI